MTNKSQECCAGRVLILNKNGRTGPRSFPLLCAQWSVGLWDLSLHSVLHFSSKFVLELGLYWDSFVLQLHKKQSSGKYFIWLFVHLEKCGKIPSPFSLQTLGFVTAAAVKWSYRCYYCYTTTCAHLHLGEVRGKHLHHRGVMSYKYNTIIEHSVKRKHALPCG